MLALSKNSPPRAALLAALSACVAAVVASSSYAQAPTAEAGPSAATTNGQVRGAMNDGIYVFKGIPYGASTAGANRFKPPQPPKPWKAVRDATKFGDQCPQMTVANGAEGPGRGVPTSEDCLVLNVWTPGLRDGKKRPVMVWMHGGGFVSGSGASAVYDGTRLAQHGDTVIVTLNHRLNAFGYLYLGASAGPEYADSGNVGQLDLIAALQWVRENIAEFGGDPATVTAFGESGGGSKIGTLMAMPLAQGLFQRAVLQSGFGLTALTAAEATKIADAVLKEVDLRRDQMRQLQSLPAAKLQEAVRKATGGMPMGIGPVIDGRSLTRHPFTPTAPPLAIDIPVIVGSNKDETTFLFPPPDAFDLDWTGLKKHLVTALPRADVDKVIAELRRLRPRATPSDLYFTVTTELGMGANARALATRKTAQRGAAVYLYRMEWETPLNGGRMRAHHALDLPLMFDNVARSGGLAGNTDAQRVADAMSAAWLTFARTGNPNAPGLAYWPAFDTEQQPTMVFNVVSRAVADPIRDVRALLENPPAPASAAAVQTNAPRAGFGAPMPSEQLAQQPQTKGAKGDQQRHYYFEHAKQEMPYRLYVPASYDPKVKTPLVVALHGFGGNQDYFFATVPNLKELLDRHGFIFVAPMGYSTGGWYGAPLSIPGNYPRSSTSNRPANVPPPAPVVAKPPEEERRERDLSEADVMNVLELVRKEYNVDPSRTYLMGHSMGGMGTYFLGQKHAAEWAAIAPMSSAMAGVDYSWERLRKVPILISVGSTETRTVQTSKEQIELLGKMGMTSAYVEIDGGSHMSMIAPTVPQIFEFFAKHRKQ
jgi:para-nitrobenzyl esterase